MAQPFPSNALLEPSKTKSKGPLAKLARPVITALQVHLLCKHALLDTTAPKDWD